MFTLTCNPTFRYPACNAHAPCCHLRPAPLCNIFFHIFAYMVIFRGGKKLSNMKYVLRVCLQLLCDMFFILRRNERHMIENVHCSSRKSVPLQVWSGPDGSRKLRFPDFMTTTQDSGKDVSLTHRSLLPPGNTPGTHFC